MAENTLAENIAEAIDVVDTWRDFSEGNLTSLTTPRGAKKFAGLNSFSSLTSIVINDDVEEISGGALAALEDLNSVVFPLSIKKIGGSVLYETAYYNDESNWIECGDYSALAVPVSNTEYICLDFIDGGGQTVTIPNNVVAIPNNICNYYTNIRTVQINSTVLRGIGGGAFQLCSNLRTINLPASLEFIGDNAFEYCERLNNVTLGSGFNCDNLDLSVSTAFTAEMIVSWLNALADRTGNTAYTLTIGSTNLAKLTAEQIAIATNKNWNLA